MSLRYLMKHIRNLKISDIEYEISYLTLKISYMIYKIFGML